MRQVARGRVSEKIKLRHVAGAHAKLTGRHVCGVAFLERLLRHSMRG